MTSNIVLPTLTRWAEQHLTTLFTATAQSDFDAAFDAFISQHVHITVNGKSLTRDQYKSQLQAGKFEESGAQVSFLGAVEVPKDPNQGEKAGTVGIFFQATIDEKLLVLGAPETRTVNSSINIVVIQDPTIPVPHLPGKGGIFDPRRVSVLNQVAVDKQNPILLPLPHPVSST